MELTELLEGKVITSATFDDGCLYLHLGRDEKVVFLQVLAWGHVELDAKALQ